MNSANMWWKTSSAVKKICKRFMQIINSNHIEGIQKLWCDKPSYVQPLVIQWPTQVYVSKHTVQYCQAEKGYKLEFFSWIYRICFKYTALIIHHPQVVVYCQYQNFCWVCKAFSSQKQVHWKLSIVSEVTAKNKQ